MQPTQPVIQFQQYSTNVGYFVKCSTQYNYNNHYTLNGIEPLQHIVLNGYVRLENELSSVKKLIKGSRNLTHYKLKDEELACKLPLIAMQYWDDDLEVNKLKGVEGYEALYEPVYHQLEDQIVDVPFEVVNLGTFEIEDPSNIKNRKIKLQGEGNYGANKVVEQELSQVVIYDDIVKLLTPEFALTQAPCKLSSKQMYSIVRQHLKENLDMKENSITSDYDFCFTVKKRVHTKPFIATESYYSGKKLKSKSITKTDKLVEVFEMSWSGYKGTGGYEGYTCIPGLHGNNLQDLSDKLDEYLDGLTTTLNKRVQECECCNGTGHIIDKVSH